MCLPTVYISIKKLKQIQKVNFLRAVKIVLPFLSFTFMQGHEVFENCVEIFLLSN